MGCASSCVKSKEVASSGSNANPLGTQATGNPGTEVLQASPEAAVAESVRRPPEHGGFTVIGEEEEAAEEAEEEEDDEWDRASTAPELEEMEASGSPDNVRPLQPQLETDDDDDWPENDDKGYEQRGEGLPPDDYSVGAFRESRKLLVETVGGCMFVNEYVVVKFLGRGACGKVFLCLNTGDFKLYAMKAVRKTDLQVNSMERPRRKNPVEDLRREIAIMRHMVHENVVTLRQVIDDPQGSKILLIMDYMEGGPVMTREALGRGERLPEEVAWRYFRDMVNSLDYLHRHKVVHGDLKPENVLMSADGKVKLSDFGCSKVFSTGCSYLDRFNGTPAFLAPEMMRPHSRYRGRPTDVYALGACLYAFVFGRIPFTANSIFELFRMVQTTPVTYPPEVHASPELVDLLEGLLAKDPKHRLTLAQVMQHRWTTKGGEYPMGSGGSLARGNGLRRAPAGPRAQPDTWPVHSSPTEPPRVDYLATLLRLSTAKQRYRAGELLVRQGSHGSVMLYIEKGVVDVLLHISLPGESHGKRFGDTPAQGSSRTRADPLSGRSRYRSDAIQGQSGALWRGSSLPLDEQKLRNQLFHAATNAGRLCQDLQVGPNDYLVAQRPAGSLVGEMALFSGSGRRCCTLRAATEVDVSVITRDQVVDLLYKHPAATHQLLELYWRHESDNIVLQALLKLGSALQPLKHWFGLSERPP